MRQVREMEEKCRLPALELVEELAEGGAGGHGGICGLFLL